MVQLFALHLQALRTQACVVTPFPMLAVDVLGWAGAAQLLYAYALLTRDPTAATGRRYVALNVAGAAGLALNGVAHGAWPSAALNILWLSLALDAVRRRRSARTTADIEELVPVNDRQREVATL